MENISEPLPPPVRLKKRIIVPVVFLVVVVVLLLWGVVRGNLTDPQPINPASASPGVLTQLLLTPGGPKKIRAAMIVPASPASVWKTVTNYDHFSDVFPNISDTKGVRDPDGRWRLTGEVRSIVGHWPMDLHVRHEETPSKCVASWDEPNDTWKVNRGNWTVSRSGDHQTLLEYNLELKVSPFPDFVVRAVLLEQLKPALRAVAIRAQRAQSPR